MRRIDLLSVRPDDWATGDVASRYKGSNPLPSNHLPNYPAQSSRADVLSPIDDGVGDVTRVAKRPSQVGVGSLESAAPRGSSGESREGPVAATTRASEARPGQALDRFDRSSSRAFGEENRSPRSRTRASRVRYANVAGWRHRPDSEAVASAAGEFVAVPMESPWKEAR